MPGSERLLPLDALTNGFGICPEVGVGSSYDADFPFEIRPNS